MKINKNMYANIIEIANWAIEREMPPVDCPDWPRYFLTDSEEKELKRLQLEIKKAKAVDREQLDPFAVDFIVSCYEQILKIIGLGE